MRDGAAVTEAGIQMLGLLGLGLVLGLEHALDADHVVAVMALVSQTRNLKKSSLLGALWGAGHTTTLLISGIAVLAFKLSIPPSLALLLEFVVGLVLVALGLDVIVKVARGDLHSHEHHHEEGLHSHLHTHHRSAAHNHSHRSFLIGMLHGLAGSGTLVLLALASARSVVEGLAFMLIFGIGSILGMWITSALIAVPLLLSARFARLSLVVRLAAGLTSIVLGVVVMIEVGIVEGLLA